MRTILALVFLVLLSGACVAGEHGRFVAREAYGYLLDDETDSVARVRREARDGRRADDHVLLSQRQRNNTVSFRLSPGDAAQFIREMLPFVERAAQQKSFSARFDLNDDLDVSVSSDRGMRLAIRSRRTGEEITYHGPKAAQMLEAVHEAVRIEDGWERDLFSRRPPLPPPPPPPPSRPPLHPGPQRPPHPAPGASRPDVREDNFTLSDLRVTPIGLNSWTEIKGKIRNNTGQSYRAAIFTIRFRNIAGREVGTAQFSVTDFRPGMHASFECTSRDDFRHWKDYVVEATSLVR